jgi:hypothetical protein
MGKGPFNIRSPGHIPKFLDAPSTKMQISTTDRIYRNAWRNLISMYAVRHFTYSRDRVHALVGLASAFQVCEGYR